MSDAPTIKPIPITHAYRHALALSAATGQAISKVSWMAFGSSDRPYSAVDDTGLYAEFARVPVTTQVIGPTLIVTGVLPGELVGSNALREASAETESGVLMGRVVFTRKEFEAESEFELVLEFEY